MGEKADEVTRARKVPRRKGCHRRSGGMGSASYTGLFQGYFSRGGGGCGGKSPKGVPSIYFLWLLGE